MPFAENLFMRLAIPAWLAGLAIAGCSSSGSTAGSSSVSASGGAGSGVRQYEQAAQRRHDAGHRPGPRDGRRRDKLETGSAATGRRKLAPDAAHVADGGYVSCAMPFAADAGPGGDGGPAFWICQPGTYTCDLTGNMADASRCTSDQDCADPQLPTIRPHPPALQISESGAAGYQNFCQQCIADSDCASNPAGKYCDLNHLSGGILVSPRSKSWGSSTAASSPTTARASTWRAGLPRHQPGLRSRQWGVQGEPGNLLSVAIGTRAGLPIRAMPTCPSPSVWRAPAARAGTVCPNAYCATDADCENPNSQPGEA